MDSLGHLTPATKTRRDLLNDTLRALSDLNDGRGVTLLIYDPGRMIALKRAAAEPRMLLARHLFEPHR